MSSAALSAPLQYVAEMMRQDGGHALGRAVLFVSLVDLGEFRASIPQIATISGVSQARLAEIADEIDRALNGTNPLVKRQHVVAQVLTCRFYGPVSYGTGVLRYELATGITEPRNSVSVGKVSHFIKIDSLEAERAWQTTENRLNPALDAARSSSLFTTPLHVETIKDAIALHYARSLAALELHERTWEDGLDGVKKAYLASPEVMGALFYKKFALYPPSLETAAEMIASDLLADTRALYESGAIFRFGAVDNFHKVRALAHGRGLRILQPASGQFLIGDVPAIPVDKSAGKSGLADGVGFATATEVVLPLAPDRLALLTDHDGWATASKAEVDHYNDLQITHARYEVLLQPASGLETRVRARRPPTSP